MWAERLKMSFFILKKLRSKQKCNAPKPSLLLYLTVSGNARQQTKKIIS